MRDAARAIIINPKTCLSAAALITILLGLGLPRIGFDIHPNAVVMSDNQASHDLAEMQSWFGADDNDVVVLIEGQSLWQWKTLEALRVYCDRAKQLPDVQYVASIFEINKRRRITPLIPKYVTEQFNGDELRDELLSHPIAANQLVSADGQMLVVYVRIRGGSLTVTEINRVLDPLRLSAHELEKETATKVRLAGHPAIRADVLNSLQRAMLVSCSTAVLFSLVVAWLLFRRLAAVVVAVVAPAVATLWTFGALAWFDVPVGGLLTALPNLVFIIGLTDAVHLLLESRRHLARGRRPVHAAYQALLHVGPACVLTSLTTMIGFGSLALSKTQSVQSFGLWAAIGTTFAMLAVVIALPSILQLVPPNWIVVQESNRAGFGSVIGKVVEPTLRRPVMVSLIGVLICVCLVIPALSQNPDIIWTETMPSDADSVLAMDSADEKLGGALVCYVMIQWPKGIDFPDRSIIEVTGKTQSILQKADKFSGSFSILNVLSAAPGRDLENRFQSVRRSKQFANNSLLRPEQRAVLVSARVPNDGAAALNRRIAIVERELSELADQHAGFQFTVTGTVAAASKNMNDIIIDLARSLAIASGLIFLVFTISFRSWKLGFLSFVPNIFPLLVTAAGLTMLGLPLQITSAVTFSLCLGLAVDDTIHVLIRFQAARRHQPDAKLAVRRAVRQVGPALVVTTCILLAGFAAMLTSPLPGIQFFAALSAVTLLAALVGDLLLFPALLVAGSRKQD